jgi:ferredoxin
MPHSTHRARIGVNPVACTGHGACAELLPERISLDEWGYPILDDAPIPPELHRQARRAVRDCPALALVLTDIPDDS